MKLANTQLKKVNKELTDKIENVLLLDTITCGICVYVLYVVNKVLYKGVPKLFA